MRAAEWFISLILLGVCALLVLGVVQKETKTQPAIKTVIVTVRGCDVIQHIQGDKLIAAHNAADQPKTCNVRGVK